MHNAIIASIATRKINTLFVLCMSGILIEIGAFSKNHQNSNCFDTSTQKLARAHKASLYFNLI